MDLLMFLIALPIISGFVCLFIPQKVKYVKEGISLVISFITFLLTFQLFLTRPVIWAIGENVFFRVDNLSSFIILAIGLFGFLICMYSIKFMKQKTNLNQYYAYLLLTLGASIGAVLANDLMILLVFWGFLGLTLYMLINLGGSKASDAAKKTFIIVGGSDALLLLGIGIIWYLTSTLKMNEINLALSGSLPILAYLCLAIGAFAKAGAMPLHTWIPASAEVAPLPVMAYLPASLDKLLGIYLLARISLDMFKLQPASGMSVFLMIIGAITVVAAVMMALIQHNLKKLLSYHAVSQVGYMVLGIGTGIPVGIAGGLFHMLNHAIYKSCLFLTGGGVEYKAGTSELDRLGGLAKLMPITFISCLVASLSISGIPPFNGFVSKWMVYQGIISLLATRYSLLVILCLVAAMFGSALTLASFMKLIHATFLGQSETSNQKPVTRSEVSWMMWLPMVILAGLCVVFGIFAYRIPLKYFINPAVRNVSISGVWMPSLATWLILIGIATGFIIFLLSNFVKNFRTDTTYVGGEVIEPEARVTGVKFYDTIKDIVIFKKIYNLAEKKLFDIYDQGARFIFFFTRLLRRLHTGLLPSYLSWCVLGLAILLFILLKG